MTTVVAWLALLVSTTTLGWQIISWLRSGAHITVRGEAYDFGTRTILRIHIVNRGRHAATITEIGYQATTCRRRPRVGKIEWWSSDDADSQLPLRLEGQADFECEMLLGEDAGLREKLAENPQWATFPYARVRGRPIYGRRLGDKYFSLRGRLMHQGRPSGLIPL